MSNMSIRHLSAEHISFEEMNKIEYLYPLECKTVLYFMKEENLTKEAAIKKVHKIMGYTHLKLNELTGFVDRHIEWLKTKEVAGA